MFGRLAKGFSASESTRRRIMSPPLFIVNCSEIREGTLKDFKAAFNELVEFVCKS